MNITSIAALAAFALGFHQLRAEVVVVTANANVDASGSDLLQTSLSSIVPAPDPNANFTYGNWWNQDETVIRDGVAWRKWQYPGGTTGLVQAVTVTYNLNIAASPGGYQVDTVDLFHGWVDIGRDRLPNFSVSYSTVADPSTFIDIVTGADSGNPSANYARTRIEDDAAVPLATGVAAVRFTFAQMEAGGSGISEIDILGSGAAPEASPEITSITLSGSTVTMTFTGKLSTTYTCKSSTDLLGFPTTETPTSGSLMTDSEGNGTFSVTSSGDEKFYRLEE